MEPTVNLCKAHLRIARPTDDIAALIEFYCDGLGFEILSKFEDQNGFDGIMLGQKACTFHLEFTSKAGHKAGRSPSEEHLLVFYLADESEWQAVVERMRKAGNSPVQSFNSYWDKQGKTFEDPDGYRIVLQNGAWPL